MNINSRHSRRRGSSTVEYALFLALIGGGIILAADCVSYAMRNTFDNASLALQSGVEMRHLPLEDLKPEQTDLVASVLAPSADAQIQVYQFASVAGVLLVGAAVWYGLYCRKIHTKRSTGRDLTNMLAEEQLPHDELFTKRQQILRMLTDDKAALMESKLEVKHLMSKHLLVVAPNTSRDEVKKLMEEHRLRHLLVCDEQGLLQGVISDRDLLSRHGATASQIMTPDVITVAPHAQVNPATTLLINRRFSCLPVVSEGVPVGVLTSTDLMMAFQCSMQILQRMIYAPSPAQISTKA